MQDGGLRSRRSSDQFGSPGFSPDTASFGPYAPRCRPDTPRCAAGAPSVQPVHTVRRRGRRRGCSANTRCGGVEAPSAGQGARGVRRAAGSVRSPSRSVRPAFPSASAGSRRVRREAGRVWPGSAGVRRETRGVRRHALRGRAAAGDGGREPEPPPAAARGSRRDNERETPTPR